MQLVLLHIQNIYVLHLDMQEQELIMTVIVTQSRFCLKNEICYFCYLIIKHPEYFELHNLYPSPNIIRMIKSRRMKLAGYVARMGEKRNAYRILVGNPEGKRPLGNQDVGGWTISKWILEK
jgi:hypothetical protein